MSYLSTAKKYTFLLLTCGLGRALDNLSMGLMLFKFLAYLFKRITCSNSYILVKLKPIIESRLTQQILVVLSSRYSTTIKMHKKFLQSDWLREVQFFGTSAEKR